jgi:tetratricopeptide (TPR) repeat protein
MNAQTALLQAITAAKHQDWDAAVSYNLAILENSPTDVGALNRLGVSYLQLGKVSEAKSAFQQVLDIDKSNSIAKKNVSKLNSNHAAVAPTFCQEDFIEEPGKTKTVELHRLAGKNILDNLAIGQQCELKPKNRYISIESSGVYVGALPEDLSFRLSKLIETGNIYSACIRSFSSNHCSVYIKETFRSPKNQDVHSFSPTKNTLAAINEVDEHLLFDDEVPVATAPEAEAELEKPTFEDFADREEV